jgi:hypothetical protein
MLAGRPLPCASTADCPGRLCQISASAFYYEEAGEGGYCLSLASAQEPWQRETLVGRIMEHLGQNPGQARQLVSLAGLRLAEALEEDGGCQSCGFVLLYRELVRAKVAGPSPAAADALAAIMEGATEAQLVLAAAEALCLLEDSSGCRRLEQAAVAEPEAQRVQALVALGRLCRPGQATFLVERMNEESSRFGRLALLQAVKTCPSPSRSPIEEAFRRTAVDYEEGL